MAAAVIPLITSLAPEVINLITSLIHQFAPQAEVTNGPGTGPVKFADVFVSVMDALTKAKVAGTIAALPDDSTVKTIIQAVITSMQMVGLLGSSSIQGASGTPVVPVLPASPSGIVLQPGQSITITVAKPSPATA